MLNLLSFHMSLMDVLEAEVTAARLQLVVARLDAAADESVVVADVQQDLRGERNAVVTGSGDVSKRHLRLVPGS